MEIRDRTVVTLSRPITGGADTTQPAPLPLHQNRGQRRAAEKRARKAGRKGTLARRA